MCTDLKSEEALNLDKEKYTLQYVLFLYSVSVALFTDATKAGI
jgi:hypothetical protein